MKPRYAKNYRARQRGKQRPSRRTDLQADLYKSAQQYLLYLIEDEGLSPEAAGEDYANEVQTAVYGTLTGNDIKACMQGFKKELV